MQIQAMRNTPTFKRKFKYYLRKVIRPPETICQNLSEWWDRYKCEATNPAVSPAGGRTDPVTDKKLFTPDTRKVVDKQKIK